MGSASKPLRIKESGEKKKKGRIVITGRKKKHCRRFLMLVNKQSSMLAYCNQKRAQKQGQEVLLDVKAEALQ